MLWLAAQDETMLVTEDGHTVAGRLAHFVSELAQIARAHNWDKVRENKKRKRQEEYDDLEGDRPSCYSGVKRRLFQSLIGHPLMVILTPDGLHELIRGFVRDHFKAGITPENRSAIKDAFDDYFVNLSDLSDTSNALLTSLNLPQEQIDAFHQQLRAKYPAQYGEDNELQRIVTTTLHINPQSKAIPERYHATHLNALVQLYDFMLNPGVGQALAKHGLLASERVEDAPAVNVREPTAGGGFA